MSQGEARIGFITCVEVGFACMREIYEVGGKLDVVFTMPDERGTKISGRVFVEDFCKEQNCELVFMHDINAAENVKIIKSYNLDWLFILWSQIATPPILNALNLGALCIHPTLLPMGRGRAAIPTAILKGLRETGVTLFKIDDGIDTGPILAQERIPMAEDETATTLYSKVAQAHQTLIAKVWSELVAGRLVPVPQDDSQATVWQGRSPEDGRLRPEMTIVEVERMVRAVTKPYPGAFVRLEDGSTVRVWTGTPVGQEHSSSEGYRLQFSDGAYLATSFDIEAHEPG